MVVFAVTRAGYEELRRSLKEIPSPLWVGDGVFSEEEIKQLWRDGVKVTPFTRVFDPTDSAAIDVAVNTIAQHHPGETIWVERKDDLVEAQELARKKP